MGKDKTPEEIEAEKLAAEKAEAERLAAEKAEAEKLAAEKAEAEKLAAEKAVAEKLEAEKAEAEKLAAEKAVAEKTNKQPKKIKDAFKAYPYHNRMYLLNELVFIDKKYAEEYALKNKIDAQLIKEYLRDE